MKTVTITMTLDEARAVFNKANRSDTPRKSGEDTASWIYRMAAGKRGMDKLARAIMDAAHGTERA